MRSTGTKGTSLTHSIQISATRQGRDSLLQQVDAASNLAADFAEESEKHREIAAPVLDALRATGLLRMGVPADVGGTLPAIPTVLSAVESIAAGDASTGWCVAVAAASSLLAGYLPLDGAAEAFGDPRAIAAGVWAPGGRASQAEGGVVISGEWSFCSGIMHSDWIFLGFLPNSPTSDNGQQSAVDRASSSWVAAVRTSALDIQDTWHTSGLRGTGSHDAVATELFVPDRCLVNLSDGPRTYSDPTHRYPPFGFFAASIAAVALGNARASISDLVKLAANKHPAGSRQSLAERPTTQFKLAEAEASLRAAREFLYRAVDDAWQEAQGASTVSESRRLGIRLAATHAVRISADVARAMYELAGASAIYEESPLQRRFRDAHTAIAHFQVNARSFELPGRLLLGLPTVITQL
jgi:alkylation response protein AidB-like acyl-CoA dehydrogenase